MDLPPFANSAMDGYALRASSLTGTSPWPLRCVGESLAGHPYSGNIDQKECIRITTGAVLPNDADCVVAQEDCRIDGDRIIISASVSEGTNVRPAGNDITAGTRLLESGQLLGEFDLAWLAALGFEKVSVYRKPRIAVFSTGDELMEPGNTLAAGQIYDSNRHTLLQLLQNLNTTVTDMGVLADNPEIISLRLNESAATHDLLLTTGGVSVGSADYLKDAVASLGSLDLWRLNLKPGKPLAFGRINRCLFIGLPGNPVSTIVTFLLIAKPVIFALAGAREQTPPSVFHVELKQDLKHAPGREEYQRGRLIHTEQGLRVEATGDQSSNRLGSFAGAHCLIRIPKEAGDLSAGSLVSVLPLRGLLN